MTDGARGRPIRLLFVQTQAEMAGAQEISRLLGDGLSRAGMDGNPAYEIDHLFLYRKSAAFDGQPHVHMVANERPGGVLAKLRFLWRLVHTIRVMRPDAVLTFQHFGNIIAAPAARLAGVDRIIANHVSAPATISPTVRAIDRVMGRFGMYDVITANSRQTWNDYLDYPAAYRRHMVLVPHGFEDKSSAMGKGAARAAFSLPGDAKLIGTAARLHPLKCIDRALRTLPLLPNVLFAVAGQGPDEPRLRALAGELGVTERVHFIGEIAPARIGDFLGALDAFVFPSSAETFGLAAVEAAQAGIPVIATDLPVLREVLDANGEPCALFVDTADSAAFASSIGDVLGDAELAGDLARRGRSLSKRHSLTAMVNAYRDLIGQPAWAKTIAFGSVNSTAPSRARP